MHWPDAMLPGTEDSVENRDTSVTLLQTWSVLGCKKQCRMLCKELNALPILATICM